MPARTFSSPSELSSTLGATDAARLAHRPAALRILLLNYEFPPLGGGAGIASSALAHRLAARGVIVDVVTSRPDSVRDLERIAGIPSTTIAENLTLFRVHSKRRGVHQAGFFGAGSYLASAVPVVRKLLRTNSYDVVHIYFSLPTGALIPALPLGDIPIIVSLRGSDVPGYDERNAKLVFAHRLLAPLTRWIWRRAQRVVPVCESLGALARETLPSLRYSVIGNGVDLELFKPPTVVRDASALPVRCIAVTRLIERKGVTDLLRAWSLLPRGQYALEIVGGGPAEHALRALVEYLGIQKEVHFAGPQSREAVALRCRESDMFVLAPHEEAFGNVFAEALAVGLPVVGSEIGAIPDLVRNGENGVLVPPGDPAALARAIRELGDDPARRTRIAKQNRQRAEKILSWETTADHYLSLYAELMSSRELAREGARAP